MPVPVILPMHFYLFFVDPFMDLQNKHLGNFFAEIKPQVFSLSVISGPDSLWCGHLVSHGDKKSPPCPIHECHSATSAPSEALQGLLYANEHFQL